MGRPRGEVRSERNPRNVNAFSALRDSARSVARSTRGRPWRTTLMASGAFVGSMSVTLIVGLALSSSEQVRHTLDDLGSRLVLLDVSVPGHGTPPEVWSQLAEDLELQDVSSFARSDYVPGIDPADAPQIPGGGSLVAWDPRLVAALGLEFESGGTIEAVSVELGAHVAVVGSAVAARLTADSGSGLAVEVKGRRYVVVGVLLPYPALPRLDRSILIADAGDTEALGPFSSEGVMRTPSAQSTEAYVEQARTMLRLRNPQASVRVEYARSLVHASAAISPVVRALAYGAGLFSAVLAAFTVLNVLLMSVVERRREIGLRLALGHPRFHVALLFLLEGALVGLLGAVVGTGTAVGGVLSISAALPNWGFDVSVLQIGVVITASVVLSLLAAALPARLAINVDPSESLGLG